ncbi:hypothetical protein B0H14DRAFT_3155973 [Mycena olivaceomarginata]|nr:hypothetical protein B0H14DRAFT_3155973 [Mycena olivaceomarginata]
MSHVTGSSPDLPLTSLFCSATASPVSVAFMGLTYDNPSASYRTPRPGACHKNSTHFINNPCSVAWVKDEITDAKKAKKDEEEQAVDAMDEPDYEEDYLEVV